MVDADTIVCSFMLVLWVCYGAACATMVHMCRKLETSVKRRVFIFSLLDCIARCVMYGNAIVCKIVPHDSQFYITGLADCYGDLCIVGSMCVVIFSWIRVVRTFFSGKSHYSIANALIVEYILRGVLGMLCVAATIFLILLFNTHNDQYSTLCTIFFAVAFGILLVLMAITGLLLRKRVVSTGTCRAHKITKMMLSMSGFGIPIFIISVLTIFLDGWYMIPVQHATRTAAELCMITCYIYFFGTKLFKQHNRPVLSMSLPSSVGNSEKDSIKRTEPPVTPASDRSEQTFSPINMERRRSSIGLIVNRPK